MIRKVSQKEADKKNPTAAAKKTSRNASPQVDAQVIANTLSDALTPFFERDRESREFLAQVLEAMQNDKKVPPQQIVAATPPGDVTLIIHRNPQSELIEKITVERNPRVLN